MFTVFAAAAAYALLTGRRLDCGCFGVAGRSKLGWIQIIQLPVVVLVVLRAGQVASTAGSRLGRLAVVELVVCLAFLYLGWPTFRRVRTARISLASAASFGRSTAVKVDSR
jgi:hypothetical protein